MTDIIDFNTSPDEYKHWTILIEGNVAKLILDVDEDATFQPGYKLKLNSYDLGVDMELYDAVQRLRFEHPEVGCVVLCSNKPKVFCAGANIGMLGLSTHEHKVNFCKFTNETRNGIEDASKYSNQKYICAINGTAAGGGYELALATDYIMLIDDGASAVSLPELPLLAVLPGTGGLTRLVDKRHVRRDHADYFCTTVEGIRGKRAVDWKLVDEIIPRSKFDEIVMERAKQFADNADKPLVDGIALPPLNKKVDDTGMRYEHVNVDFQRDIGAAVIMIYGPKERVFEPNHNFWPLAMARELDDAILHLRMNESELGTWIFKSEGDNDLVEAYDEVLSDNNWFINETRLFIKRTFKRLDVSSRSIITLIEPGSCFTGTLFELVLAADRSFMLDGTWEEGGKEATVRLTEMNFGPYIMCNDLTRLEVRFIDDYPELDLNEDIDAVKADKLGLVTFIPGDLDWKDEVRIALEERASFSPDGLTGMEASLRFPGQETIETKIFARLSAWQNWIFQRPNATGETGALKLYGTGKRSKFDKKRV